jgi:hypothetical protein
VAGASRPVLRERVRDRPGAGLEVEVVEAAQHRLGVSPPPPQHLVELHQHALDDRPRLFYMHLWAVDDGVRPARALRPAVDAHNVTPAG